VAAKLFAQATSSALVRSSKVGMSTLLGLLTLLFAFNARGAQRSSFFDDKVKPILCERCVMCHNDTLKNGEVSFLHRHGLIAPGPHGAAIVPGKPGESILIHVIRQDGDVTMPPGGRLPVQDIGILTEWVRRGAPWGDKSLSCVNRRR